MSVACSSPKADVVFVIDSSGSIGSNNFRKVKNFVKNVVGSFDISNNTVRVGLVQFSDYAVVEFDLLKYSSTNDVTAAVSALQYHGASSKRHLYTLAIKAYNSIEKCLPSTLCQRKHNDKKPSYIAFA